VFVEGHSQDDTWQVIEKTIQESPRKAILLKQPGKGKGDAIGRAFRQPAGIF
jgi:hypothetical protein